MSDEEKTMGEILGLAEDALKGKKVEKPRKEVGKEGGKKKRKKRKKKE